ncbi:MAG TPA: hypothetical protein VF607_14240 [Verrucomicrobiae bacterium]
MKKFVILSIGLLLLLVLVIWLPGSGGKRTAPASSRAAPFASSTKSVPAPPPAAVAAPTAPVAPLASRAGALAMETLQVSNGVALPPATVLDNARVAIHNYCATFGENPVGNNAEITAALRGNNPRQVQFIPPDSGLQVNALGELVDGYGTPFFFHQLSGTVMEIRSAGQDRKLWTFDDQVVR